MDKWDVFKENLAIAEGAEGALTEQADIYAESWKAARDRVTASLENIYDSLVNEQFFIDLDNVGTPILNGIASIADALGGVSGVLNVIGATILTKFGPQVSQWLSKTYADIRTIFGLEQQAARALQISAVEAAVEAATSRSEFRTADQKTELKLLRQKLELQNLINSKIDDFNENQRQSVNLGLQQLELLKNQASKYEDLKAQAETLKQENADRMYDTIAVRPDEDKTTTKLAIQDYLIEKRLDETKLYNYKKLEDPEFELEEYMGKMVDNANVILQQRANIQALRQELSELIAVGNNSSISIEEFKNKIISTNPSLKDAIANCTNFSEIQQILKDKTANLNQDIATMIELAAIMGLKKPFTQYIESANEAATSTIKAKSALELFQKAYDDTIKEINSFQQVPLSASEKFVQLSNAAMQTGLALQSIKNIGNIFTNDNLSGAEKLIQLLITAGMAAGSFKNLSNTLTNTITRVGGLTEILSNAQNKKQEAQIAFDAAQKSLPGLKSNLTNTLAGANANRGNSSFGLIENEDKTFSISGLEKYNNKKDYSQLKKSLDDYNKSVKASAAAEGTLTAAAQAETKAQETLKWARIKANLILLAVTVAITAAVKIWEYYAKKQERAKEAMQKAADAVQEEKDKLTEINDELKTTQDRIKELQEQGTLTFVEQQELSKLQSQNSYLENQLKIQEKLTLEKQKQQAYDIEKNDDTAYPGPKPLGSDISSLGVIQPIQIVSAFSGARSEGVYRTDNVSELTSSTELLRILTGDANYIGKLEKELEGKTPEQQQELLKTKISTLINQFENEKNKFVSKYDIRSNEFGDDTELKTNAITEESYNKILTQLKQLQSGFFYEESLNQHYMEAMQSALDYQEQYNTYLKSYNAGAGNLAFLEYMAQKLKKYRMEAAGQDEGVYFEWYIKPVLDDTAMEEAKIKIYKAIREGQESVDLTSSEEAVFRLYGIDPKQSYTDIVNLAQEQYEKIGKKIYGNGVGWFASESNRQEFNDYLSSLTDEDYEIFLQLNPELITDLDSVQHQIEKIKATKIDLFNNDNLEKAKTLLEQIQKEKIDPIKKAFQSYYSNKGFLTIEEAQELISANKEFTKYLINNGDGTYKLKQQALEDYNLSNQQAIALMDASIEESNKETNEDTAYTIARNILEEQGSGLLQGGYLKKFLESIDETWDLKTALDEIDVGVVAPLSLDEGKKDFTAFSTFVTNSMLAAQKQLQKGKITAKEYYDIQIKGLTRLNGLLHVSKNEYIDYNAELNKYQLNDKWTKEFSEENLENLTDRKKEVRQEVLSTIDALNDNQKKIDDLSNYVISTAEAIKKNYKEFEKYGVFNNVGLFDINTKEQAENLQIQIAEVFKAWAENQDKTKIRGILENQGWSKEIVDSLVSKAEIDEDTWKKIINSEGGLEALSSALNAIGEDINIVPELNTSIGTALEKLGETISDFSFTIDIAFKTSSNGLSQIIAALGHDKTVSLGQIGLKGSSSRAEQLGAAITAVGEAFKGTGSETSGFGSLNPEAPETNDSELLHTALADTLGKNLTEKNYTVKSLEEISKLSEPFKDIDNTLEGIENKLKDVEKQSDRTFGPEKVKKIREEIDLINKKLDAQNEKTKQASDLVNKGFADYAEKYNDVLTINEESGAIDNIGQKYEDLNNKKVTLQEEYNKKVEEYNAIVEAGGTPDDTAFEAYKKKFDSQISYIEAQEKDLKQLEDWVKDYTDNILKTIETLYDKASKELFDMETRFETIYKRIELRSEARELQKEFLEFIRNDENYNNITQQLSNISLSGANWAYNQYEEAFRQYTEARNKLNNADKFTDIESLKKQIEESLNKMKDSFSSIKQYITDFEETYTKAVDNIGEKFTRLFDLLSHEGVVLEAVQELYEMQNITAKTADGFNKLSKAIEANYKTSVASAKAHKNNYEAYYEEYVKLGNLMLDYEANSYEYQLLLRDQQKIKDLMNQEEESYLSAAKEAFTAVEDLYSKHIENIFAIFEDKISNGLGFDFLEETYSNLIEEQDRYLDNENSAYEALTLKNKIQKSLLDTQNQYYVNELQSLKKEIEMRKTNGKLTQYDVDLLTAKYNLTLAQMALEDAQNAKNSVRLVRNSSGNWDYQFTADQTAIDNAEQNVLDKRNELYNIEKDRLREVEESRVSILKEYSEKMQEVAEDTSLDDDTRKKKVDEINRYYKTKVNDLSKQAIIVRDDLKELGIDVYTEWGNQYGQMLANTNAMLQDFDNLSADLTSKCFAAIGEYQEKMKQTSEDTGTVVDDLNKKIDNSELAIDSLNTALGHLNDTLKEQFNILGPTIEKLDELIRKRAQLEEVKDSYNKVTANEIHMNQEGAVAASGYAKNVDYLQLMIDRWNKNGHTWDSTMEMLNQERDTKSLVEGITEVTQGDQTKSAFENGDFNNRTYDKTKAAQRWKDYLSKKAMSSFDTGGYTGEFQDGKLALLHQKELVLNQDDTQNILSAVSAVREISPEIFKHIEQVLDSNAKAGFALMGDKLFGISKMNIHSEKAPIEQNVVIQADFPGVSSAVEIENALINLANDAAQEASIYS